MPSRPPKGYWDIDNTTNTANIEAVLAHFQNYTDAPIDAINVLRRALAEFEQRAERAERRLAGVSSSANGNKTATVTMHVKPEYTRDVSHQAVTFVCAECSNTVEIVHYPGAFMPTVCSSPVCQTAAKERRAHANTDRQRAFRKRKAEREAQKNVPTVIDANLAYVTPSVEVLHDAELQSTSISEHDVTQLNLAYVMQAAEPLINPPLMPVPIAAPTRKPRAKKTATTPKVETPAIRDGALYTLHLCQLDHGFLEFNWHKKYDRTYRPAVNELVAIGFIEVVEAADRENHAYKVTGTGRAYHAQHQERARMLTHDAITAGRSAADSK